MANRVYLDVDGIIRADFAGDQEAENVTQAIQETAHLAQQLRQEGKPVKILDDLTKMGKSSPASRKLSRDALKQLDYDKIALFSDNIFIRTLSNLIIQASGQGRKVKYFNSQAEAEEWLGE